MLRGLCNGMARLSIGAAFTASTAVICITRNSIGVRKLSYCSDASESKDAKVAGQNFEVAGELVSKEEKEANDLRWEEKAKSCPLCRLFIESPCAEEFKAFSDCADRAKATGEEVADICRENEFSKMRECMQKYPDHFEDLLAAEDDIVSDDDEEDQEVVEEDELASNDDEEDEEEDEDANHQSDR